MTLALGIDPGTATTGYGLVRLMPDGELMAVSYGIISTPKEASAPARLEMLFDQLNALLKEHKPDTAAVEKLFSAGTTHAFPSLEVIVPSGVMWLLGQLGIKSAVVVMPSP